MVVALLMQLVMLHRGKSRCTVPQKYTYNAKFAQRRYEELRSSSRQGVNLTRQEALAMNAIKVKNPLGY